MLNRYGLDRFKKAQSTEPFSVSSNSLRPEQAVAQLAQPAQVSSVAQTQTYVSKEPSTLGGGNSTWQPPDWAVEPRPGIYWLEVMKDGELVDTISLTKRRCLFGRMAAMCDYVLDHPSVSRQHAAVVQHKNGGIYVFDLGSVHGTFVANERLSKDSPMELEVGQSLRFGGSTRSYVLRKLSGPPPSILRTLPDHVKLPPRPDPADEDAVVQYNTILNQINFTGCDISLLPPSKNKFAEKRSEERQSKKQRKAHVSFRDDAGGILVEMVGYSDGADVSTVSGPVGLREGSLVGKYESLVQVTIIPNGSENSRSKERNMSAGVTDKLKEYMDRVKTPSKGGGLYEDIYGESLTSNLGGSWATPSKEKSPDNVRAEMLCNAPSKAAAAKLSPSFVEDDLFGDDDLE